MRWKARYSTREKRSIKDLIFIISSYMKMKKSLDETFINNLRRFFPHSTILDFNYGRTALKVLFRLANLKGKKIIMPAYSCDIFTDILMQERVKSIFVDADPRTFNMDIEKIAEVLASDIDALLTIHTYSNPSNLKALIEMKEDNNFILIEDCAHSFGAKYNGIYVGTFGDASVFSMYKTIPNISGGFLSINNMNILNKKEFENFNILEKDSFSIPDLVSFIHSTGDPIFTLVYPFKKIAKILLKKAGRCESIENTKKIPENRCSDFAKYIFNYYLNSIDTRIQKKNDLAKYFYRKINKIKEVQPQYVDKNAISAWMNFSICINKEEINKTRDEIVCALHKRGIICDRVWYNPIILSPKAQKIYKIDFKLYKNTIDIANNIINLPMHYFYTKKDIDFIVNALMYALNE